MIQAKADILFKKANRLWFIDGYTNQAADLYGQALQHAPDDAAICFQLGQVWWAFGDIDRARAMAAMADKNRHRLNKLGQRKLDQLKEKLAAWPPDWRFSPVDNHDLDIERLEQKNLSTNQWLQIAYAAKERGLFGVARRAFAYAEESYTDFDLIRDREEMAYEADLNLGILAEIRSEPTSAATKHKPKPKPRSLPPPAKPTQPDASATENQPTQTGERQTTLPISRPRPGTGQYPVQLDIAVVPERSIIGAEIELTVVLTNISEQTIAVNKRMLLNRPDVSPGYGEIFLYVTGPEGYQNKARFTIRTGPPTANHFTLLSTGQSIRKSFRLWKFESLHLPGNYEIVVVYHNGVAYTVKGIQAFAGTVTSHAFSFVRILRQEK
jgi:hypothetical protein